jgi:hypothetical protein
LKGYISGAVTRYMKRPHGLEEVRYAFDSIESVLSSRGFAVCNPFKLCPYDPKLKWIDYMRVDISGLMLCDFVVVRRDWFRSRGARIEVLLAFILGLPIYSEKSIYRLRGT